MRIKLSTLGRVRCDLDDQELTDLPGQRLRCALLVYLAVERKAPRETIQNLFWSDRDDEKGRGALKQTVYELRRILGEDCIESHGDVLHIHANATVDLHDFERAVEEKNWQAALAQYGGEFLHGFSLPNCKPFEFWVDRQRAHAARLHRTTRRARLAELLRSNDGNAALAVARRWVELEPLEDEAQHALIDLLAATGERAEALRQADNYERLLQADGLTPLDETKKLVERIRKGDAAPLRTHRAATSDMVVGVSAAPPVPLATPVRTRSGWKRTRAAVAAAAILLVPGVWWTWVAWVRPRLEAREIRSIAVVPCDNKSANKEQTEYLSDGLTDDLITALTQIEELYVPARTSSFAFKGRYVPAREVGAQLHVSALVECIWRQQGTTVRVTASLINVANGRSMWGKTFEAELRDPFALQDEIVRAIVNAIAVELGAEDAARLAARPTVDLEAEHLYSQGRFHFRSRSRNGFKEAVRYFEAAVARDPKFALAYSGLADAYINQIAWGVLPVPQACAKAKPAALKAVVLDSTNAETRASAGLVFERCDRNPKLAEREYRRALQLNPNYAIAHSWYGIMLTAYGRGEEGIRESREARRLDPLSAVVMNNAAQLFNRMDQPDSAIPLYRAARAMDTTFNLGVLTRLAAAYMRKGMVEQRSAARTNMFEQAAALLDTVLASDRSRLPLGFAGFVHAQLGHREQALSIVRELEEMAQRESVWDALARTYVGLGEYERAMSALERLILEPAGDMVNTLSNDATLDPLRDDLRFIRILERVGIASNRRASGSQAAGSAAPVPRRN